MKTERGAGLAFVCARHPGEMPVPKTWFLSALLTIHTSCPVWLAHNPSAPWPGWGWAGKPHQASQGSVTSPRTPRLKGKVSVLFKKCHAFTFFSFSAFCFVFHNESHLGAWLAELLDLVLARGAQSTPHQGSILLFSGGSRDPQKSVGLRAALVCGWEIESEQAPQPQLIRCPLGLLASSKGHPGSAVPCGGGEGLASPLPAHSGEAGVGGISLRGPHTRESHMVWMAGGDGGGTNSDWGAGGPEPLHLVSVPTLRV